MSGRKRMVIAVSIRFSGARHIVRRRYGAHWQRDGAHRRALRRAALQRARATPCRNARPADRRGNATGRYNVVPGVGRSGPHSENEIRVSNENRRSPGDRIPGNFCRAGDPRCAPQYGARPVPAGPPVARLFDRRLHLCLAGGTPSLPMALWSSRRASGSSTKS